MKSLFSRKIRNNGPWNNSRNTGNEFRKLRSRQRKDGRIKSPEIKYVEVPEPFFRCFEEESLLNLFFPVQENIFQNKKDLKKHDFFLILFFKVVCMIKFSKILKKTFNFEDYLKIMT